jgi:hypothetical protein
LTRLRRLVLNCRYNCSLAVCVDPSPTQLGPPCSPSESVTFATRFKFANLSTLAAQREVITKLRPIDHVRILHPNSKQQATTIPQTIRVSWTQEIHSFLVFLSLSLSLCVCVCVRVWFKC